MLIVTAKFAYSVQQALPQLIVYLASLRQSRLQRERADCSVYGATSDGMLFNFAMITHDGTVMLAGYLMLGQSWKWY
jgi:hypothetical protein